MVLATRADGDAVENASDRNEVIVSGVVANWRSVVVGVISIALGAWVGTLAPNLSGTSGFYRALFFALAAVAFLYTARNVRQRLKQYYIAERVAAQNG